MTTNLPPWLKEMLDNPPKAGQGVHHWLFCASRQLHAHYPATEIVRMLESAVAQCGRSVPQREILCAVRDAVACAWTPNEHGQYPPPQRKWPPINQSKIKSITSNAPGLADLWDASPIPIQDNEPRAEFIIDSFFPGNPLLCCGQSNSQFQTQPRQAWRGQLASLQLIVPSPMSDVTGLTKEGKESMHTLNNTGPRRFLVVEFDQGTIDDQAAIALHLSTFGPLVCAVFSGSKSLHLWFYCANYPEEKLLKFMRYAVSLGADHATWCKSQFCRLPDGRRDNGNRQSVFYLNLNPLPRKT